MAHAIAVLMLRSFGILNDGCSQDDSFFAGGALHSNERAVPLLKDQASTNPNYLP
jgi:hypothetical protein